MLLVFCLDVAVVFSGWCVSESGAACHLFTLLLCIVWARIAAYWNCCSHLVWSLIVSTWSQELSQVGFDALDRWRWSSCCLSHSRSYSFHQSLPQPPLRTISSQIPATLHYFDSWLHSLELLEQLQPLERLEGLHSKLLDSFTSPSPSFRTCMWALRLARSCELPTASDCRIWHRLQRFRLHRECWAYHCLRLSTGALIVVFIRHSPALAPANWACSGLITAQVLLLVLPFMNYLTLEEFNFEYICSQRVF